MMIIYEKSFKQKLVRQHLDEKRSISSLSKENGVSAPTISRWVKDIP